MKKNLLERAIVLEAIGGKQVGQGFPPLGS
jgi:hypothetical protein